MQTPAKRTATETMVPAAPSQHYVVKFLLRSGVGGLRIVRGQVWKLVPLQHLRLQLMMVLSAEGFTVSQRMRALQEQCLLQRHELVCMSPLPLLQRLLQHP